MPIQQLIIAPGQTAYIPAGAILLGIEKTGDADVSSDCIDLQNIEEYQCYFHQWELAATEEGSEAWEEGVLDAFVVAGVTYALNLNADLTVGVGYTTLQTKMQAIPAFKDVFVFPVQTTGDRRTFGACFKTVASVAAQTLLKFHSGNGAQADTVVQQVPMEVGEDAPCDCSGESEA